jgi:glycogen debranching enzyme GlgX/4-alpha-glucanotransferase
MTRRHIGPGWPEPLGVTADATGVNVAVFSANATAIAFCLFDAQGAREIERIRLPERSGDIHHGHIAGVGPGERYGLRAEGPFDPANGQRFNPAKLLLDPYAMLLDRPFVLHPSMFGYSRADPARDLSIDGSDSGPAMPKAIVQPAQPQAGLPLQRPVPWDRTVLYELHVRGFSKLHPGVPEAVRGTFAGLSSPAALDHLVRLGVTSVEVMPAMAWIDERHLVDLRLSNYWGYNPVGLCAPDPRLAPGGWQEIRRTVDALHAAGIEVILDVVLNHSGEGDELGPTLSLRGLDNAGYYRLHPGEPRLYVDDTGTGNTLALDRPPVTRLAMDSLRAWATRAGLDGFRFDLAATLGRRPDGFDPAAPLLAAIAQDPLLRGLKLIAEPWDIGPGGHQTGRFPFPFAEWNDRYRDTIRRFWRGDAGLVSDLATRLAGSADLFAAKRRPARGVNFITAHDGFALADLVAYEHKRNDANGEGNRDGTNASFSWNHGVEGPSDDPVVKSARLADQRALIATLLVSRGTPMLAMGAELGHSQAGNNNAYAQDNATSWLDWDKADTELAAFTAAGLRLRAAHPALRVDAFLTGAPLDETGIPDVAWLSAEGEPLRERNWTDPERRTLVLALYARDGEASDRVAAVLHRGGEPIRARLPRPREGKVWHRLLDSAAPAAAPEILGEGEDAAIPARAVVVFAEVDDPRPARSRAASPESIARLAHAVGLAPDWWDLAGRNHPVSLDTQRAALRALRIEADTAEDAKASLEALARERFARVLPLWSIATAGEAGRLRLGADAVGRALRLRLAGPDGAIRRLDIGPGEGEGAQERGFDGRLYESRSIALAPLPAGDYRVLCEESGLAATLVVAPARAFRPESLAEGVRRFGVAAHLYSLRRADDQGIGDFTTLAEFGAACGQAGAITLGLNPLHALFPAEPERASPYHPSDRRFLDPNMIALDVLPDLAVMPAVQALLEGSRGAIDALRAKPAVDYAGVAALKQRVLAAACAAYDTRFSTTPDDPLAADFAGFVAAGGEGLRRFALFEAIAARHPGLPWPAWPGGLRRPDTPEAVDFAARHGPAIRHAMLRQWLAERQLREAARHAGAAGLALGFYRDLAVGAAPDGAEIWSQPGHFAAGLSIGAPPDPFSAEGQMWALPPPDPLAAARMGAQGFGELLAANMRHAGALRIDHAMGLARLFVVPEGGRGADGAYLAMPFDLLLARLKLESARARCLVVGEDLGTVPDGFRETLGQADILSYRVLWFERDGVAFRPPRAYPERSVACVSTHDLPTLVGWWSAGDLKERRALGLLSDDAFAQALLEREADKQGLAAALAAQGLVARGTPLPEALDETFAAAIHAFLAGAASCLVLAQADDLAGEADAVNLPGTDRERPNWRRRLAVDSDGLLATPWAGAILAALRARRG